MPYCLKASEGRPRRGSQDEQRWRESGRAPSGHRGGLPGAGRAPCQWERWRASTVCVPRAQPCRDGNVGAVLSKHPKGRLHCRAKAWEARPEPLLTPRKRPRRRKPVTPDQLSPGGIPFSGPAGQSRIAARVFPFLSLRMELQALQALVPGLTTLPSTPSSHSSHQTDCETRGTALGL